MQRPRAPDRAAPAEHEVGVAGAHRVERRAGSWAGSIEPSASQKQTNVGRRPPRGRRARRRRSRAAARGRRSRRARRRSPPSRRSSRCRPRSPGSRPAAGTAPRAATRPRRGRGGRRRPARGPSRLVVMTGVRTGGPSGSLPAPAPPHTLRLMTAALPTSTADGDRRAAVVAGAGSSSLVAAGVLVVWLAGRAIIRDGGDLHLRGGYVAHRRPRPVLSARVLLPRGRRGRRRAVGTVARPPAALAVAARRERRRRRRLGGRAGASPAAGGGWPSRWPASTSTSPTSAGCTASAACCRPSSTRCPSDSPGQWATHVAGHPPGALLSLRAARPDRARRGRLGRRALHRRGSAGRARGAGHRARGRRRGRRPHGGAVRRPLPRGGLDRHQRRRVLRRRHRLGRGAAGARGRRAAPAPAGRAPGPRRAGCCSG